jgi:REP element-mobilizing transposase RayT
MSLSQARVSNIIALIKMARSRQLSLPVRTWGGRREGAGRKPGPRPVVLHRPRSPHKSRFPLHVTLRARADVGSLRRARLYSALEAAIAASSRSDFRLVHFSVQGDHVHLIAEARDEPTLSTGMRGLMIRVARALNRASGRSGPVWADRYHCRELRTPREVRHALAYVLLNARKHDRQVTGLDPCSSARWFDGWREHSPMVDLALDPPAVVAPRTWLLGAGWRRHGLLRFDEVRSRT